MILNIIDRRKRLYLWKRINAVAEATSHDNSKSDGDQVEAVAEDITYSERKGISLAGAIMWANGLPGGVTLYLYDEGCGVR